MHNLSISGTCSLIICCFLHQPDMFLHFFALTVTNLVSKGFTKQIRLLHCSENHNTEHLTFIHYLIFRTGTFKQNLYVGDFLFLFAFCSIRHWIFRQVVICTVVWKHEEALFPISKLRYSQGHGESGTQVPMNCTSNWVPTSFENIVQFFPIVVGQWTD